jgi:hypothetical protein
MGDLLYNGKGSHEERSQSKSDEDSAADEDLDEHGPGRYVGVSHEHNR